MTEPESCNPKPGCFADFHLRHKASENDDLETPHLLRAGFLLIRTNHVFESIMKLMEVVVVVAIVVAVVGGDGVLLLDGFYWLTSTVPSNQEWKRKVIGFKPCP